MSCNIITTKNGKRIANLRYETRDEALEIMRSTLTEGSGLDAEAIKAKIAELDAKGGTVVVLEDGRDFYYSLVDMVFEGGERVRVDYVDGTSQEGTILRRTAAGASEVKVRMDGSGIVHSMSPHGLKIIG